MTDFKGKIGRTLADSEPYFDARPHPGKGAPNVVIVLLDDLGYAQFGCYGSDIDTPNIDALAATGLRFTDFHVAPMCTEYKAYADGVAEGLKKAVEIARKVKQS